MKKILPILLFFIILFSSCTIEKMRYSKGYRIEWVGKKNHQVSIKKPKQIKVKTVVKNSENNANITYEKNEFIEKEPEIIQEKTPIVLKHKNTEINKRILTKKILKKPEIRKEISRITPTEITQKNSSYKTEKTQLVGIALFLISILFAVLGYVFFLILGVFFGPIFLVIFLIAAVIYFIAGILSLLV